MKTLLISATLVALAYVASAQQALTIAPKHRYRFDNASGTLADGAQLLDSIGSAHGAIRGSGASATGTGVRLTGGSGASAAYIDLPNGSVSGSAESFPGLAEASYEVWVTVQSTQNWARVLDFGNNSSDEIGGPGGTFNGADYLMVSASIGTANDIRFERGGQYLTGGGTQDIAGGTTVGTRMHLVATYDTASSAWKLYKNGVLAATVPTLLGPSTLDDLNVWLGRSNWSGDANSDATYDEFRSYDYALSPQQVLGNYQAGPDVLTSDHILPVAWTTADIGAAGIPGSAWESGGTYTIAGSGADIWGTVDAFRLASTTLTGDGEIRARVTSQGNTDPWAKAGVMIRDGSGAGAVNAFVAATPSSGFTFQWRSAASGSSALTAGPATNAAPNNWVRLTRSGPVVTAYVSANGSSWTLVGSTTLTMASGVSVGLAVTSHNNAALSTATFDNVAVTPYPSPWITADIGSPGLSGRSEFYGNVHTLTGAGTLGGTTDSFRYTYQALSGDGSIVARIPSFQNTGTSARVGVMVRDTLANNARMVALSVNGSGAWQWQRRTTAGGSVTTTASGSGTAPNVWVRIVRSGNSFTASRSTNGTTWTTISSATVTMATNCYIGLNVASGTAGTGNTSSFDNLAVAP